MAGGPRDLIVTLPLLLFLQLISGACERGDGDGTMHRYELRAEVGMERMGLAENAKCFVLVSLSPGSICS